MRIYISGPVTGVPDYRENFEDAEQRIYKDIDGNAHVINPARVLGELPEMEYEEYMKISLHLLGMCDTIYMLDGWQQSTGANRELGYALASDMLIIKEDK
jgi:hypothetical protein